MSDLNKITVIGRITRTPELKSTSGGTSLCQFSIASSSGYGDKEYTNYFDCNLWGKRADSLHQYLMQGLQLAIEGEMRQNRWEKDGQKRSKIEINVSNIQFLARPKDDGSQPMPAPTQQGSSQFDDDIPW